MEGTERTENQKNQDQKKTGGWKVHLPLICSALFLSFTVCFYAPVEMFLINRRDFGFGLLSFLWMPVLFAIAVCVICVGIGLLLRKNHKLEVIFTGLLFAAGISIYVQANFLNMGVGTINGKEIDWAGYRPKMLVHLLIFLVIFAVITVFFVINGRIAEKIALYGSVLLILMQSVALVSLLIPAINEGNSISGKTAVFTGDGLYEIGDEGNIIVFVLDSYDSDYFKKILAEEPEFTQELPGFTFFSNHSGTNYETQYGIVPLVTGHLYRNEEATPDWLETISSERMFYDELLDSGFDIGIYTSDIYLIPERIKAKSIDFKTVDLKFKSNFTMFKHLYRMVACKYMPDVVKPYIWLHGLEFENLTYAEATDSIFTCDNAEFLQNLAAQGISVTPGTKAYRLIHLNGAHAPFDLDADGNPTEGTYDESNIGRGALRMAEKYLDEMKKQGVYDNSTIIITADHGNEVYDGELANPVFLIKPAGVSEGFTVNDAPVWPLDFAPTVAQMAGSANYSDYGTSVFDVKEGQERERFIYSYVYGNVHKNVCLHQHGIRNLIEYRVPSDAADPMRYELTGREFLPTGEVIDHFPYCETCKNHVERDTSTGYVTWVHTAAEDHPLMCDCESWW